MAEEYKNASEEFKNAPEHEAPKISTTEEPSAEVKDRGLFDFLGKKKEEVKPQETTTPLESEFEHKAQISEPPAYVAKHEEEQEKEHKPTLLEQIHHKHEVEEENKPSLLQRLHRSNSSSSSSSEEEGEDGEKRKKKEKKKIVEGENKTEEENRGVMDKIKEKFPHGTKTEDDAPVVTAVPVATEPETEYTTEKKGMTEKIKENLPGHSKKPEDSPVVNTAPVVETATPIKEHKAEHSAEHPAEKKGILEKIKEKLPGYHAKTTGEEEMKEKESDA